jgi:hypothetical protein
MLPRRPRSHPGFRLWWRWACVTALALHAASAGHASPSTSELPPAIANDWWSLQPLAKPALPGFPNPQSAVRNPIDAFIQAKLREHGLSPSPPADPRTLIRRLHFDLLGLPPTPEEVEAFVRNCSPAHPPTLPPAGAPAGGQVGRWESERVAYERLVDRLLASPHYGERWARHWLDVVHYGDTHGYDKDKPRPHAWPYRDYVIRAFNEDKPYARFVQEQVAGDVLFPGTRDGIEALGFIAAGPWDFIGHVELPETKIDGKVVRHLDRDDMVVNTLTSFMSLTVGCAACHDHKFDPVSQREYYGLQAVFAALDRADKPYHADPALMAKFTGLEARRRTLTQQRDALEKRLHELAGPKLADLDKRIADASKQSKGNTRAEFGYHSAIEKVQDTVKWVQVDLGRSVVIDRIVLRPCYDDFNNIGAGFGFPVRFKVEAAEHPDAWSTDSASGAPVLIADHAGADVPNPGTAPQSFAASGATARFVRVTATKLAPRKGDFIFALAELQVFDSTGHNATGGATVTALDSIEAPPRWRRANLVDAVVPDENLAGAEQLAQLRAEREKLIATSADAALLAERREVQAALDSVQAELAKLPKPDVVYAGTVHHGTGNFRGTGPDGGAPRPIHLLRRGSVEQPADVVRPGALRMLGLASAEFALPAPHPEGARRAALAKWLTDPQNALTWRSIVNRVWQHHFGRGLVETPNDFGRMGAEPSHPELLDWLACEFRDSGGSFKHLHRLIVMSGTYRQTSTGGHWENQAANHSLLTPSSPVQSDPDNRLLSRQNRRKLDAESLRDSVLLVSGRLDPRMGGPAFQDFVVEKPEHSPHYQYHLHDPGDPRAHRRSIYRFIVRSQLQPFMTALDCADPSIQVGQRTESLSPLQALTLLNNGLMVTMAQHFAARLEAGGGEVAQQVERGFHLALGRRPAPEELAALTAYAREHGLANYARLLFNLNEFTFVD